MICSNAQICIWLNICIIRIIVNRLKVRLAEGSLGSHMFAFFLYQPPEYRLLVQFHIPRFLNAMEQPIFFETTLSNFVKRMIKEDLRWRLKIEELRIKT